MRDYSLVEMMSESTLAATATVPANRGGTECEVVNTDETGDLSITVSCLFATAATGDLILHVISSPVGTPADATVWDTVDYVAGTISCVAATRVQKTFPIEADPHFLTAYVVNKDLTKIVENIVITKVSTKGN